MFDERIKVTAYSGYRGEETPRTFILRDKRIEVVEIQERWVEEGFKDRTRKMFFEVSGSDGVIHKIYYDEKSMEWYYRFED
jgi:hypothetical protein